jgi:tetratricopeptide (TPR) repeat protein
MSDWTEERWQKLDSLLEEVSELLPTERTSFVERETADDPEMRRGGATGNNLGDVSGAAAAFEKATEIAEWLTRNDPADRKALFDLVSAQLRLGSILLDDPHHAAKGLNRLQEAERNIARLLSEEPDNYRYRYNAMFIDRKIGEGFAAAGMNQEAARRWEKAAAATRALLNGPMASIARLQRVFINATSPHCARI